MRNIIETASEIMLQYEVELLHSNGSLNKGKILLNIIDNLGLKITEIEKPLPKEITDDDLLNKRCYTNNDNMTVGYLMDFINENNIPRNSLIFTQRVEDSYFETGGWETRRKKGECYYNALNFNQSLKHGEFEEGNGLRPYSEEELEASKDQYAAIWSPAKYDGDDNLYLDLHY